jgi:hypothetical protein
LVRAELAESDVPVKYPIRGTFVDCCASAEKPSDKNIAARPN